MTETRRVDVPGRCTMPTGTGRICRRSATVQYLTADGRQVAAYCTQHDSARSARARMLHVSYVASWDYAERRIVADFFPGTDVQRGPFGPSQKSRALYA